MQNAIYEKIFPDFLPAKALEYSVKNLMFCHAQDYSAARALLKKAKRAAALDKVG